MEYNEEIVSTDYDESKDDVEKIKETLIVLALERKLCKGIE